MGMLGSQALLRTTGPSGLKEHYGFFPFGSTWGMLRRKVLKLKPEEYGSTPDESR